MKKEYLPIGSVVLLKGAIKRIMITGFYVKENLGQEKTFDYVGVLYPEGLVQSDKNLVFNDDQIEKVYFEGFRDIEEQKFKEKLYDFIFKNEKDEIINENTQELPVLE